MRQITYIISSALCMIMLFCLQLCILKYEQTINCNLILVSYAYSLFAPLPMAITAFLILMLDALNFLMTGYFGYLTIILTLASIGFVSIKDNFYNKLVMPFASIATYYFCQLMIMHATIHYPAQLPEFVFATTTCSILFMMLWWLAKHPFHD